MRQILVAVTVVMMMALGAIVSIGRGADAQEPLAMASHPIVGMWRVTNELGEGVTFPSLAMFHADGTYIEDYPDAMSYSMGVWEPSGERTAAVTIYQVYTIDDRLVNAEGRWTAEVNEMGDALKTVGTFVGTFEDGSIDIAVEWSDEGYPTTRLGVEPVVPLADLVPGGTPVIPNDVNDEGTPASLLPDDGDWIINARRLK